jgi:hypothetical protein
MERFLMQAIKFVKANIFLRFLSYAIAALISIGEITGDRPRF